MSQNAEQKPDLPLFYTDIKPLDKVADVDLRIRPDASLAFTAKTNAIPLVAEEFPFAALDYPIVFAPGASPVPVAVVGLERDKNMMVDKAGRWRYNKYIPAYVRRYPFILVEDPENQKLVLCFEKHSSMLGIDGETPLFKDGEATDTVKVALDFCMALRDQGLATDEFVKGLQEQKLLEPANIEVPLPNGGTFKMDGFLSINREKFLKLPADVIADWHKKQWLDLIYAHFISSLVWQKLLAQPEE